MFLSLLVLSSQMKDTTDFYYCHILLQDLIFCRHQWGVRCVFPLENAALSQILPLHLAAESEFFCCCCEIYDCSLYFVAMKQIFPPLNGDSPTYM
jgi:hypothetical protein